MLDRNKRYRGPVFEGEYEVLDTSASRDEALQGMGPAQCPQCLLVFALLLSHDAHVHVYPQVTKAPRGAFHTRLPVKCQCGWYGSAIFYHA